MTNFTEANSFDAAVHQWATTDLVQGGPSGVANTPLQSLTNRTRWLYNTLTALAGSLSGYATLDSPPLTGTPTVPTPGNGDSSAKIPNTGWVNQLVTGILTVDCTAGGTVSCAAASAYGVVLLTGSPSTAVNAIFPATGKWEVWNGLSTSTTVTLKTAAGSGVTIAQGTSRVIFGDAANIKPGQSDLTNAALLGAPTTPTPAAGSNNAGVASTAYVDGIVHGVFTDGTISTAPTGTWTVPAGVFSFVVEIWGAGSGSWGSNASGGPGGSGAAGGGGAGGGYARKRFVGVAPGTAIPYVVGAGGSMGVTGSTPPGSGGQTSFGAITTPSIYITAAGGKVNPLATLATPGLGAKAGTGAGGDLNLFGADGGSGDANQGGLVFNRGGYGGEGPLSGGMENSGTYGSDGYFPGGGASGAGSGSSGVTAYNGAKGANGQIIITW